MKKKYISSCWSFTFFIFIHLPECQIQSQFQFELNTIIFHFNNFSSDDLVGQQWAVVSLDHISHLPGKRRLDHTIVLRRKRWQLRSWTRKRDWNFIKVRLAVAVQRIIRWWIQFGCLVVRRAMLIAVRGRCLVHIVVVVDVIVVGWNECT